MSLHRGSRPEHTRPVLISALSSHSNQQGAAIKAGASYFIAKTRVDKDALELRHKAALFNAASTDDLVRQIELELARCLVAMACERLDLEAKRRALQETQPGNLPKSLCKFPVSRVTARG